MKKEVIERCDELYKLKHEIENSGLTYETFKKSEEILTEEHFKQLTREFINKINAELVHEFEEEFLK